MRLGWAGAGLIYLAAMRLSGQAPAQPPSPPQPPSASSNPSKDSEKPAAPEVKLGKPVEANTLRAQRRAARLYLQGVKLLEKQQPERAWTLLKEAAQLAPENATYLRAAELARQTTVTQLVQQASRVRDGERTKVEAGGASGDIRQQPEISATTLLQRALSIDPKNPLVVEHLNQLGDEAASAGIGATSSTAAALQEGGASSAQAQETLAGGEIVLEPKPEKHSFHVRGSERQLIQDVFRAYGIDATVHESVASKQVRLDVDDATFAEAMRVVALITQSFYEPIDPHRVIVARDTRENRTQFQRQEMETVYLGGLTEKELTDVTQIARNLFDAQQAAVENTAGTMTIRAPAKTLAAFNTTIAQLEEGKSQVDLNVQVFQLAHVSTRETGTSLFQQTGVYNLFSEANSILSQNQAAVQQIIASGLVPNATGIANQLKIIEILLAAGQLTGPPFNEGLLLFGNGIAASVVSVQPVNLNLSLSSSDTRMLDDIHLQLADGEDGTFKIGERYPIETSQFSSAALPAIAGISSALEAAASQTVPQIQYQDIGLTLKATPKVMRSNDVALTIDLKIDALGGTALNSIPILNSQQVSGVITLRAGETAVMVSDLSRAESRALSGTPGIGDIPGLQDFSDITKSQNVARLLVVVTPRVTRNPQRIGHGPILAVDKAANSHSFN